MGANECSGYVVEPEKQVPIVYDVDVAVIGAGIAGLFAALAAGNQGAKTLLIDRFGSLGGNIGPAMIALGSLYGEADVTLVGGLSGLPKTLINRLETMRGAPAPNYADETNLVSYLGVKMAEEYGVELLLAVWAADPIIEDDQVVGLFVEGKSGRVAVKAKVVVDASADVDMARRAGVPVIAGSPPDPSYAPLVRPQYRRSEYRVWNDTALFYLTTGIDFEAYDAFTTSQVTLSETDQEWLRQYRNLGGFPPPLLPKLRQAWESGEFQHAKDIEPRVHIESVAIGRFGDRLGRGHISARGEIRREDMKQHSRLEASVRIHAYETVQFYRNHVPGFEEAYLLFIAPYFGARGGPCIDAEQTITPEEAYTGQKFDDVMFRNIHEGQQMHGGEKSGFDVPYRMILPKGLDGLLVTGRGSGYIRRGHDPTGMRARPAIMILGEATGIAAALAVKTGGTPRTLDVKALQQEMLQQGAFLGDEARLTELGLR